MNTSSLLFVSFSVRFFARKYKNKQPEVSLWKQFIFFLLRAEHSSHAWGKWDLMESAVFICFATMCGCMRWVMRACVVVSSPLCDVYTSAWLSTSMLWKSAFVVLSRDIILMLFHHFPFTSFQITQFIWLNLHLKLIEVPSIRLMKIFQLRVLFLELSQQLSSSSWIYWEFQLQSESNNFKSLSSQSVCHKFNDNL